jgi:hypothetical protein
MVGAVDDEQAVATASTRIKKKIFFTSKF